MSNITALLEPPPGPTAAFLLSKMRFSGPKRLSVAVIYQQVDGRQGFATDVAGGRRLSLGRQIKKWKVLPWL